MQIDLTGRVAVVTGASKGLGLAVASRMAQSGADVVLLARGAEALEEAKATIESLAHGRVLAFSCDVSKAEAITATYQDIMRTIGRIDVVVNNAGTSQTGAFLSVTDEVWQADLDLKLFAAIRLTRLAWPQMVERRWGRVINVLNIGAKAPKAGSAPTSVSRAAGMALTKVLAGEGAPHNVLVNALNVGLIDSDQWVRRHAASGSAASSSTGLPTASSAQPYSAFLADMGKNVPLGRVGRAEEFANMACFLASEQAAYITGVSINVDGNLSPVM